MLFTIYTYVNYILSSLQQVTEVLYVHTKLMIVDDRVAIIGSGNMVYLT